MCSDRFLYFLRSDILSFCNFPNIFVEVCLNDNCTISYWDRAEIIWYILKKKNSSWWLKLLKNMLIKEGCQTMYHHLILSCDACDINPMKEPYFFWFWIFYVVYFLFLFSFFFFLAGKTVTYFMACVTKVCLFLVHHHI